MNILEVCVELDGGGIDRYVFNNCMRIEGIHFDFTIVKNNKKGILEDSLEERGFHIFKVPRLKKGLIGYYKSLKKIMKNGNYDAVHVHLGYKGFLALLCAKRCGIKTRIAHAHIADEKESFIKRQIRKLLSFFSRKNATHLVACGIKAAKYIWGKKAYEKGNVVVLNNAIDTNLFQFNVEMREQKRKELGFNNNEIVIGNVGRLTAQKNQLRILDIFNEIHKKNSTAKLVLVGRGDQEKDVEEKIKALNLSENVILLGVRTDVPQLLNAFDVFLFPSLYEGLPFTLVECQSNGLPALCSDTITQEIKILDTTLFLSLERTNEEWASKTLELAQLGHNSMGNKKVMEAGYDLNIEAQRLKEYYLKCIKDMMNNV